MTVAHRRHDLSCARLQPRLPKRPGKNGRPAVDHRRCLHAVCWMLRTGAPGCDRKGSVALREAVRDAPDFAGWTTGAMTARRSEMLSRIRTWRLGFRRGAIGKQPRPDDRDRYQ